MRWRARVVLGCLATASLGGCSSTTMISKTTDSATVTGVATTSGITTANSPADVTTAAPTPASTAAESPTSSATAPTPAATYQPIEPCNDAGLTLTLGDGEGAAGSTYVPIVFTNATDVSCTLDGHPGVSFVDSQGAQVGPAAERTDESTPTITLAPGGTAHANLRIGAAGNYSCQSVTAATLKVFPPDETVAKTIGLPTDICTDIPQGQLTIGVVIAGSSGT